jgi:tRNA (mo5U34)-methyltransferase
VDVETLKRRVSEIEWYHSIDLGHGIVTPGHDLSSSRLPWIGMPKDLTGMTVLDVGAWDGFFSFEAERRGARRVLAVDSFSWSGQGWGTKAGFHLAREALGSKVEDRDVDVLDLSAATVGVFDLVLFLGVLYHMRHPLLALERIASVTGRQLILETDVDLLGSPRPAMAFYPADELRRDPTNWWGPNPAAVSAMLKDVGFRRVDVVSPPYRLALRVARAANWKARGRDPVLRGLRQGRMVVHAIR